MAVKYLSLVFTRGENYRVSWGILTLARKSTPLEL
jgi:hypothetical protein